ncbi:hypothetical protein [Sphingobacterium sp.]|uniref:hypothetical protein n=1 Tax=Sphingobacterium sp. TaxID=341027 RepID=UPI00258AE5CE|nr:hypothetical protein [Sphingobacterium sp.]WET68826.1 MAG: hypothetical protein P0Y57_23595 [Sphingobacterium sp.]
MLYNPFEQVTKNSFRELVESGYADFVLQRFEWPDVKEKTGFLLTPYDKEGADQHAHQLGAKEGRALQLPQDADKIESLLETGSGYRIFLNRIKEENWDKRMLKLYEKILSITCVPRPGFSAKIQSISYSPWNMVG